MPRTRPPYPEEFRREAIELARISSKSQRQNAEDLGISDVTLRNWIKQAERDEGKRPDGLSSDEREELARLRRENQTLRMEREILKKAAALFRPGERGAVGEIFALIEAERANFPVAAMSVVTGPTRPVRAIAFIYQLPRERPHIRRRRTGKAAPAPTTAWPRLRSRWPPTLPTVVERSSHDARTRLLSRAAPSRTKDVLSRALVLRWAAYADRGAARHKAVRRLARRQAGPQGRWADGRSPGRALAHADAARLLWREGAGVERAAAQLLHAAPAGDCDAVESLCAAAALASRRGAPAVQATYLLRALAEPPAAKQRAAITLALGRAQALTGDSGCLQTLELARAISDGAREGSVVALELGRAMMMFDRSADAFELWAAARAELADSDPALSALLEAEEVGAALLDVSTAPRAIARLAQPTRLAEDDSLGGRLLLAYGAYLSGARGVAAVETARAAQRALRGGELLADQTLIPWSFAVATLTISDRFDSALEHTDAALAAARESGSLPMFQVASWLRAWAQYRRGALAEAEADAQGALDAAAESWFTAPVGFVVDVLLERGECAEAERLFDAHKLKPELFPNLLLANLLLDSRARLRCAQGHWGDGLGDLLAVGARLAAWQTTNPALVAWRSNAALAHLALGEHDQARRLAAEEVELARSFAAPRALGVALRAAGLIEGGERGLELPAKAVAVLEDSHAKLALALALTDYGAALRRHGLRAAAREPLRRGLDLADRCGASVLRRRAREELLAAGARPRRERIAGSQALTASERRVATLAAQGLTNKEIAQALFITVKTVKAHLGHSFGKLDIATRGQLADALSD